MSKGNCFTSYSVMTEARARHHLTTAAIKLSWRNAYFRAGPCLPTIARFVYSLALSLSERPRLITVKQLNVKVFVIIATTVMTTVIR